MALSMHTNYASLVTQNTLNNTNGKLDTAMERLSTGLRINSNNPRSCNVLESKGRLLKFATKHQDLVPTDGNHSN